MKEVIYGLECVIPEYPNHAKIDYHNLKKKDQKFTKIDIPEDFYDVEFDNEGQPIYSDKQQSWIKEQFDRIVNGYFFFNNGIPTYITGDHYYYLTFWTLESGFYPEYRDADRKWFLFYKSAINNPDILGIIRVKKRREGATSQTSCLITKAASTNENTRCGIISKTGGDASDVFQNMVVYGFRGLPIFLQPRTDGTEDPKKKLVLVKQSKKKANKIQLFNKREGLNSFIEWRNTALNSFDSGRWSILLIDEAAKFPKEVPIIDYWNIVKKTLTEGSKKVGFALVISTVNPPNNGGQEFKNLWDDSNQFKHGSKTPSKLVRYLMPADEGLAGCIDEYGFSQTEKARKYILENYRSNDQDTRDYFLNEQEAFKFNDIDCHFNLDKIEEQEMAMKEKPVYLRRGNFYLANNKVEWADDKSGNWLIYKFPTNQNNFVIKNGAVYPVNTAEYGIGTDPYRSEMTSGTGSMGSIWCGEKLDITRPDETCLAVGHYYGRPKIKKLFWKENLMAALFWGCPVTIETDAGDDYYQYFKSDNELGLNCLPMLGKKPDVVIDPNRKTKSNPFIRGVTSGDPFALNKQLEYCINYIEHHCNKIFYPELLDELKRYRHDKRTEYDRTVSFMIMLLTLMGQTKSQAILKKRQPLIETYSVSSFNPMNIGAKRN